MNSPRIENKCDVSPGYAVISLLLANPVGNRKSEVPLYVPRIYRNLSLSWGRNSELVLRLIFDVRVMVSKLLRSD